MSNYFGTDPEREGLPGEDDGRVEAIEVHFAIPTWITPQQQQQQLGALLNEIVRAPANTPRDGVHWIAGIGNKPLLSRVDAALLGTEAAPSDNSGCGQAFGPRVPALRPEEAEALTMDLHDLYALGESAGVAYEHGDRVSANARSREAREIRQRILALVARLAGEGQ